jgi:N-acetylglucosaminyldiphosphoundecaprenol N-acetyl-beta-D-mannosaminyltransferase
MYPRRVSILGTSIDPYTMDQTIQKTKEIINSGEFAHLIGVNADKILQIRSDSTMKEIVNRCEIVNADGASMLIAAKRLNVNLPERVAGIDLMLNLCKMAQEEKLKVFLLGAKQEVVEKTSSALLHKYPNLNICGIRNGYFNDNEFDAIAEEVSKSQPDIVFVGITSPKKELLIERFRELGLQGAFVGVGGSFDVVSGNIPRAPLWMQKAKLEWLFRLCQEPGRLLKRYLVGNIQFLHILNKEAKQKR